MNKQETKKVIASLMAAYPAHYRQFTTTDIDNLVSVWHSVFEDYSYNEASAGVKVFLASDVKGFPPSPGQVIECILKAKKDESAEITEDMAWAMVLKAIRNSGWHAEEEFNKLPEIVKKIIREPGTLHRMAIDDNFNMGVEESLFRRSFRSQVEHERLDAKIPSSVKRLINSTAAQISVNNDRHSADGAGDISQ